MPAEPQSSAPAPAGSVPTGPPTAASGEQGSRHGDLVAGGLFVALGAAFAVRATGYGLGTWNQMGAGMFPFLLGLATAGLGVAVVLTGLKGGESTPGLSRLPWRGMVCVLGAVVFFAFAIRGLGLIPAAAGTVFLSCLASPAISLVKAVAATVGITAACYVVFVLALQLQLPLFA